MRLPFFRILWKPQPAPGSRRSSIMRTTSLTLSLAVTLLCGVVAAAQTAPQELGTLLDRARAAYDAGRYDEAAQAYQAALAVKPGDATTLYNLACCHALSGAAELAAAALESSWRAGAQNIEQIRGDHDFDKVRDTKAFKAVMARLEAAAAERERELGEAVDIETPTLAHARVALPDGFREGSRYPLLVGLHGGGATADNFVRAFAAAGVARRFIFCAPQGLFPAPAGDQVIYTWVRPTPGQARVPLPPTRRLAEDYLASLVGTVVRRYPVDPERVYVMGFSQGGFMATSLGLRHPELFRGVIPIGGYLGPADWTPERLAVAAKRTSFLLVHSPGDSTVPYREVEAVAAFLRGHDVPFQLLRYDGGHVLTREVLAAVARWVVDGTTESSRDR
jgi:phospholipase/carboxylesterase